MISLAYIKLYMTVLSTQTPIFKQLIISENPVFENLKKIQQIYFQFFCLRESKTVILETNDRRKWHWHNSCRTPQVDIWQLHHHSRQTVRQKTFSFSLRGRRKPTQWQLALSMILSKFHFSTLWAKFQ